MKKVFISGIALALLFSQGLLPVEAKGQATKKPAAIDKNKDGIPDSWELKYKLGLGKDVPKKDTDKDGLNNLLEYKLNLNPASQDTDKDKLKDGQEDTDQDGLSNETELELLLDPSDTDTDDDNIKDGLEDPDKDGIQLSQEVRGFKLKVKTLNKKKLEVDYRINKGKHNLKINDQTGKVTPEMITSLVNDLHASPELTKDDIVSKIQTALLLESSFEIELTIKYFNSKEMEIEKETVIQDDAKNTQDDQDDEDDDQD